MLFTHKSSFAVSSYAHTPSVLHTQIHIYKHYPSRYILLGHHLLAVNGFCFLLSSHCLAWCLFIYLFINPNAFSLSTIMIVQIKAMPLHAQQLKWEGLTDHLNWIRLFDPLLSAAPLFCFSYSFPACFERSYADFLEPIRCLLQGITISNCGSIHKLFIDFSSLLCIVFSNRGAGKTWWNDQVEEFLFNFIVIHVEIL